ncbi:MAG: DUF2304 domain-containing protein [Candidatus Magasanikbacteria bacterium]|nr:DUF2304 domain-containing protein [Candidatus Magasanikbacteria bacterium]
MLVLFQLLVVLFALFAILSVLSKKKEGLLGFKGTIFWILFWVGIGVVAVWPNTIQNLADRFGIGRGVDLAFYISIALLFFLIFKMNVKIEGLKRDLSRLTREDSLRDLDK